MSYSCFQLFHFLKALVFLFVFIIVFFLSAKILFKQFYNNRDGLTPEFAICLFLSDTYWHSEKNDRLKSIHTLSWSKKNQSTLVIVYYLCLLANTPMADLANFPFSENLLDLQSYLTNRHWTQCDFCDTIQNTGVLINTLLCTKSFYKIFFSCVNSFANEFVELKSENWNFGWLVKSWGFSPIKGKLFYLSIFKRKYFWSFIMETNKFLY